MLCLPHIFRLLNLFSFWIISLGLCAYHLCVCPNATITNDTDMGIRIIQKLLIQAKQNEAKKVMITKYVPQNRKTPSLFSRQKLCWQLAVTIKRPLWWQAVSMTTPALQCTHLSLYMNTFCCALFCCGYTMDSHDFIHINLMISRNLACYTVHCKSEDTEGPRGTVNQRTRRV